MSDDSDQPGHPPSLIRVSAVRLMGNYVTKLSSCSQRPEDSHVLVDIKADLYIYLNIRPSVRPPPSLSHHPSKVRKRANIRNRYNQAPHLTQDTNGKVTTSYNKTSQTRSQEASTFPAGDLKASINRRARKHNKHKTDIQRNINYPQKKRLGTVSKNSILA